MAIFNMSVSNIKRGKETNLLKAYAYISGEAVKNEINEEVYKYKHAERVLNHGTILAPGMPENWADGTSLMHELEQYEKSPNARLGKRVRLACAYELSDEENIKAAKKYIDDTYTKNGYAVSWAYHVASDKQVEKRRKEIEAARRKVAPELPESEIKLTEEEIKKLRNPHVHIIVLDRQFKNGKWQAKEKSVYKYIQQKDEKGNLLYDQKGNAIYEINPKTGKPKRDFYIDKKTGEPKRDKNGRLVYKKSVVVDNLLSKDTFFKEQIRGNWAKELNKALARNDIEVEVTEKSNIDAAIEKAIAKGEDPEKAAAFAAIPQEKEYYRKDKIIENAMIWKINKTQEKVKNLFQTCLIKIQEKIETITKAIFAEEQKAKQEEGQKFDSTLWHPVERWTRKSDNKYFYTPAKQPCIRSETQPENEKQKEYKDYFKEVIYLSDEEFVTKFIPAMERQHVNVEIIPPVEENTIKTETQGEITPQPEKETTHNTTQSEDIAAVGYSNPPEENAVTAVDETDKEINYYFVVVTYNENDLITNIAISTEPEPHAGGLPEEETNQLKEGNYEKVTFFETKDEAAIFADDKFDEYYEQKHQLAVIKQEDFISHFDKDAVFYAEQKQSENGEWEWDCQVWEEGNKQATLIHVLPEITNIFYEKLPKDTNNEPAGNTEFTMQVEADSDGGLVVGRCVKQRSLEKEFK